MSDIRYNSWLHRSGTGGVYQDSSGRVGIGTSVGMNCLVNSGPNNLTFGTGTTPAERVRIDTSGRVMIGNSSAASLFSVANNLVVGSGSGSEGMTIYSDSSNDGYIVFADGTSDPAYRMGQIIYSHQSNKLQFRTNGNTDRLIIDNAGNTNISGVTTAKTFVPTEGQLSHRNLIFNGAMTVAQRGTSSTTEGYSTIDRFSNEEGSCDEAPTQSQHGLNSADTGPWAEGFRNSFHIQNGNQTSGAQAANFIKLTYQVEARDMANSGWNYTSTSSYITLSFWVKSSVAQNFYGRLTTHDGTAQNYPFETGSLSANTWTKITKKIPGNSNITINNDNGAGFGLEWMTYRGGNTTDSGVALDTWAAYASGTRTPDQTSTWFTTNDATFEVTGVQLEVGSVATPFEHRSYGDELLRCQRYYQQWKRGYLAANSVGTSDINIGVPLTVPLRAAPSIAAIDMHRSGNKTTTVSIVSVEYSDVNSIILEVRVGGWTGGNQVVDENAYVLIPSGDTMKISAEL